jgi:hypothetical protein
MSEKELSKKHPPDRKVNEEVAAAVKARVKDGELPCAVAFSIADEMKVAPAEVGFTLDMLAIRLVKCQLGLYGYKPNKRIVKPAERVSPDLEKAIRDALVNGRLPCLHAWQITERFGLRKMEVSSACETLGVKISACQLGSF